MRFPVPAPQGTYRPTLATVDLDAIAHNLRALRALLDPSVSVCAIVKADAYGHGAVPVSRVLEEEGVEAFAVASVEEGLELRGAGITGQVLVLGADFSGIDAAREHGLTPVIYSTSTARRVSSAARKAKTPIPVHLKLDTGMGRLGLLEHEWRPVLEDLAANPWIRIEGIATHFSSAEFDPDYTREQIARFGQAVESVLKICGPGVRRYHLANSAGIVNHPESASTMVRPGLLLYGVYPDPGLRAKVKVKPAMTFRTRVLLVKSLPPGSPVSYGRTFVTKRSSRIAILPVGYADGYPRALSNRGKVLVQGHVAPVVGNVTMDLTMVDVTELPAVSEGDEAILFGPAEAGCLPVEDVARTIDTIPYELLCAVSRRVPRVYYRDGRIADVP